MVNPTVTPSVAPHGTLGNEPLVKARIQVSGVVNSIWKVSVYMETLFFPSLNSVLQSEGNFLDIEELSVNFVHL